MSKCHIVGNLMHWLIDKMGTMLHLLYNFTSVYTNIHFCRRDESKTSFPLQEGIFIYSRVFVQLRFISHPICHMNVQVSRTFLRIKNPSMIGVLLLCDLHIGQDKEQK